MAPACNPNVTRLARSLATLNLADRHVCRCELFALSGERNPYEGAQLDVLPTGAWADMILVNGDPTRNMTDYERKLGVVIKSDKVWKNMLG